MTDEREEVRVKPNRYQPTKAEVEEVVRAAAQGRWVNLHGQ